LNKENPKQIENNIVIQLYGLNLQNILNICTLTKIL